MTPQQILEIIKWLAGIPAIAAVLYKYGITLDQIDWIGKLLIGMFGAAATGVAGWGLYASRPTGLALAVKQSVPGTHVTVDVSPGSKAPEALQEMAKDTSVSKIDPVRRAA